MSYYSYMFNTRAILNSYHSYKIGLFKKDKETKKWILRTNHNIPVDSVMFKKPLPELIEYLQELNDKYPGVTLNPGYHSCEEYGYGEYDTIEFTFDVTEEREATEEEMVEINEYLIKEKARAKKAREDKKIYEEKEKVKREKQIANDKQKEIDRIKKLYPDLDVVEK